MIRNRKAKNSLPLPPGYIPVNMGHYLTPGKKLNMSGKFFSCLKFFLQLSFRALWLLCLIFGNEKKRGSFDAISAHGLVGLNENDFVDNDEHIKYLMQQKW